MVNTFCFSLRIKVFNAIFVSSFSLSWFKFKRTYNLINLSTDEGMLKLLDYLRRIGVDDELRRLGAKDGDTVTLCDFEFDYIE